MLVSLGRFYFHMQEGLKLAHTLPAMRKMVHLNVTFPTQKNEHMGIILKKQMFESNKLLLYSWTRN